VNSLDVERRRILSRAEAEDYLHIESALLDNGDHEKWLDLFADDARYWVPCNQLDHSASNHVSLIYDTKQSLAQRIMRLKRGRLVQEIPSRTLHQISNVRTDPCADNADMVDVKAGLVVFEQHLGVSSVYPAHCRYLLRHEDDGWRIVLKHVALLANDSFLPTMTFLF
jgi:3-phenylpropionate/cinnamic acid dioxygenase small subunit